jgi:phosphatidylethanolamine-binding protein (PEBP) family uncharacterized protein
MRRRFDVIAGGALVLALALAGCGSGSSASTSEGIALASPALKGGEAIPPRYTCDGRDLSLPLEWSAVPPEAKELVLFIFNLTPVDVAPGQTQIRAKLSVQWAVAGLKPTLNELAAGRLPHGAILGRNASGRRRYSLCPTKGTSKNYLVRIYALRDPLSVRPGFNGMALYRRIVEPALARGQFLASYARA